MFIRKRCEHPVSLLPKALQTQDSCEEMIPCEFVLSQSQSPKQNKFAKLKRNLQLNRQSEPSFQSKPQNAEELLKLLEVKNNQQMTSEDSWSKPSRTSLKGPPSQLKFKF
jgi:hypothetical protein